MHGHATSDVHIVYMPFGVRFCLRIHVILSLIFCGQMSHTQVFDGHLE